MTACGLRSVHGPPRSLALGGRARAKARRSTAVPEQIRVTPWSGEPGWVAATVVGRRFFGAYTVLSLELADGSESAIDAMVLGEDVPPGGAKVGLSVAGSVAVYPLEEVSA